MTTELRPLSAPPAKGRSCIFCHTQGDSFNLITHNGYREQCIFHRMCYPKSQSAALGTCERCGVHLHECHITYIASDADSYQTHDLARFFSIAQRLDKQKQSYCRRNPEFFSYFP